MNSAEVNAGQVNEAEAFISQVKEGETKSYRSPPLIYNFMLQSHTFKTFSSILNVDNMCQLIYGA